MALSLIILLATGGILIVGLAAALVIAAIFIDDREQRWLVLSIIGALWLLFVCCLLGAGGVAFYTLFQPM